LDKQPSSALPSCIPTAAIAAKAASLPLPPTSGPVGMRAGERGHRRSCSTGVQATSDSQPPEHRGPAHRCPSSRAISAEETGGSGVRAWAAFIRAAKPHPCRLPHKRASGHAGGAHGDPTRPEHRRRASGSAHRGYSRDAAVMVIWPLAIQSFFA
jgi:hypothetical protein